MGNPTADNKTLAISSALGVRTIADARTREIVIGATGINTSSQYAQGNYPPLFFEAVVRGSDRAQAMMPTMTAKGFAPLSLAVSTVVRTSASASAAHMAR